VEKCRGEQKLHKHRYQLSGILRGKYLADAA
jgi:hypothetical protein